MLNSSYGQFISSLWRGKGNGKNIKRYTKKYYEQIKDMLLNGIDLKVPTRGTEKFNIIQVVCADLGFIKEIFHKVGKVR